MSSASVMSLPFLSFIKPIFAWNVPLVSLIFLKRSLVFPILLFSSISLHWSLRKVFLFLLASLWNASNGYIFPFLLWFSLLFFSLLFVRPPQTTIFPFLHFFFLEIVLITCSVMSDSYNYMDCRPSDTIHGISQAKVLEWVAIFSSRGSSQPRDGTHVSFTFCIGKRIPYNCTTWKTLKWVRVQTKTPLSNLSYCSPFWNNLLSG